MESNRIVENASGQASVTAVGNAVSQVGNFVKEVTTRDNPYELKLVSDGNSTRFSCSTVDPVTGIMTVAIVAVNIETQGTLQSKTKDIMEVGAAVAEAAGKHFAGVRDQTLGGIYGGGCRIGNVLKRGVQAVCLTGLKLVGEPEPERKRARVEAPASAAEAPASAAEAPASAAEAPASAADSGQ
jgi:hypothetical protein